jgi:2Fe-2S ferredoxin
VFLIKDRVSVEKTVRVRFSNAAGEVQEVLGAVGQSLLEVAHENDVDLEGACGGALSCSTCHVIVAPQWFDKLPKATEEEEDMLDLAFGLQKESRLGCQIVLTQALDGITVQLPEASRHLSF